ncbi:hypothetical protein LX64_02197 [Chitinophaga skermanii]|uniref:Outer membrane protein with beta-barrel domain n=1 Tax=Chitinophaga skermanii TaxID=331697 RepID=A0A327QNY0_9BACT|nr:hypothetical protein [Chitinophaga skermanii]RAJ05043.1 hypothetical protein LX64_02197 [Chitinophaga skermanii]
MKSIFKPTYLLFVLLGYLLFNTHQPACAQQATPVYPRITGYVGILHPIVTAGDGGAHFNFDGAYVAGLPTGINIWKSSSIGFSLEVVPFIRAADGTSKMNNLLFHPGVLIGLGNGFTLAQRAAFETSGRYGVTAVLNKVVLKKKDHSYFIALPVNARFGNEKPSTVGIGFQFGIAF